MPFFTRKPLNPIAFHALVLKGPCCTPFLSIPKQLCKQNRHRFRLEKQLYLQASKIYVKPPLQKLVGNQGDTKLRGGPKHPSCSPFPKCRWSFFPENLSETVDDTAVCCLASPGGHLQSCLDNISRGHQRSSRHTFEEKKATFNPPKDFIHPTRTPTAVTTGVLRAP